MLLLLAAACAWWAAVEQADDFDDAAVLPAGVRAGTLEVPVGAQVVLWSDAADAEAAAMPRCRARDLTFDQQLMIGEPVHDYRRGVLAGGAGRALDRVLPSRWTPVAVLHSGGSRLRLTCDPASTGDLAVSAAPAVEEGVGALRHGWTPLAGSAAVMTLSGAGLLGLGAMRLRNARRPVTAEAPVRPGVREPAPVSVPAQRRREGGRAGGRAGARPASSADEVHRKSMSSMSVSVPSDLNRSSS